MKYYFEFSCEKYVYTEKKALTRIPLRSSFIIFRRESCTLYLMARRRFVHLPKMALSGKKTNMAPRPANVDTPDR